MASIKEIVDDLNAVSGQVSTQVRTLALSVLAVAWLFLSSSKDGPPIQLVDSRDWVIGVSGLCIAALAADLFQYVAGYYCSKQLLDDAEARGVTSANYDPDSFLYRLRTRLFQAKLVLIVAATTILLALVGRAIAV